jgi:hypothetical protein
MPTDVLDKARRIARSDPSVAALGIELESIAAGESEAALNLENRHLQQDGSIHAGLQALFVLTMPPRTMAGLVSEGMLYDIGFEGGITPVMAVPEQPVPDRSRAG